MTANLVRHPSARQWWVLAGFVAAVTVVAVVGALAVAQPADDYAALARPGWAPPSWLFGPVWTLLYAMIALAGWLVWRAVGWGPQLVPYAVQLVLNAAWTPLFFGAGQRGVALVDIVALWVAVGVTVLAFRKVSTAAAWLLVPYWLWVTFATALNFSIWQLNQG
ncbi:TspO/MBR family protein [Catellatospora tritici]|uniref:TspO/MBR family protein n=1 Tax=Catellatospora tritici TaxID=2851566 RepID=UPI001C2D3372|nr:TspO/MBR family protein [Catellatospora tritici]MBV1849533.1 tryptophan-rich sensory protein [Catellatospora tritici]MBV1854105.1 tryptophan-rich sensory protein [Catellatospora tritici]